MKKKIALIISLVLVSVLIASCGASVSPMDAKNSAPYSMNEAFDSPAEAPMMEGDFYYDGGAVANYTKGSSSLVSKTSNTDFAEKMIYSASATVETTDFEKSVEAVYDLVESYGGFLESSYITGQRLRYQWENYTPTRTASFTIRVPAESFTSMKSALSGVGNVVDVRDWAENITAQYYDTQSRLDTYRLEQERVMAMMEKAETVSDMLELESRLSEIRYQIESLESTLRNWQRQVDYSTVNLTVEEVQRLTVVEPEKRSYWQRVGDGFMQSIEDIGYNISEMFIDFVAAIPALVILAVVIVVIVIIVRVSIKRSRAKKMKKFAEQQNAPVNKDSV